MKIKPEHYEQLKALIAERRNRLASQATYAFRGRSEQARRWDALRGVSDAERQATCEWLLSVYLYADDDHIDTALRTVFEELGL